MKVMKLWLISRPDGADYDQFSDAVVAAETKEEARMIHPNGYEWDGKSEGYSSWTNAENVVVELLGTAKRGTKKGVVCASFHAG